MLCLYLLMVVQIIVESFPISSSSHLMLVYHALQQYGVDYSSMDALVCQLGQGSATVNALLHCMHGPTIVVIALFFAPRWILFFKRFSLLRTKLFRLAGLVCVADLCTFIFFILFKIVCTASLHVPLGIGLIVTAICLWSITRCSDVVQRTRFDLSSAVLIGCVQGIALLPGISRFALTYAAARWLGYRSRAALELSFVVEWPLLVAGFGHSVYQLGWIFIQEHFLHCIPLLIMLIASVAAFYGLRLSAYLLGTGRAGLFAGYMIVPLIAWICLVQ